MKKNLLTIILSVVCGLSIVCSVVSLSVGLSHINDTTINEKVEVIESTLEDLESLDTTLDGKIKALETKVTTLESELTKTNTAIETLESDVKSLQETKETLEADIKSIKADIESLKAKDTELEGKITTLETTLNSSVDEVKEWVEDNYVTIESCEELEDEIKGLITSLDSRVTALEKSVNTLNGTVEALEEQVKQNEEKLDELEIRINCLEGIHVWTNGVCEHCELICAHTEFTFTDNDDGTHKKDCTCDHEENSLHTLVYTADDDANTITESCGDGCGYTSTITLKAPTGSLIYNGKKQEATVEGTIIAEYEVKYNAEPLYVSTYTATITIEEVSISVTYEIIKDPATGEIEGEWVTIGG